MWGPVGSSPQGGGVHLRVGELTSGWGSSSQGGGAHLRVGELTSGWGSSPQGGGAHLRVGELISGWGSSPQGGGAHLRVGEFTSGWGAHLRVGELISGWGSSPRHGLMSHPWREREGVRGLQPINSTHEKQNSHLWHKQGDPVHVSWMGPGCPGYGPTSSQRPGYGPTSSQRPGCARPHHSALGVPDLITAPWVWPDLITAPLFQSMFRGLDANKDGVISFEEMSFGSVCWAFCAGPENPFSLLFGPVMEE